MLIIFCIGNALLAEDYSKIIYQNKDYDAEELKIENSFIHPTVLIVSKGECIPVATDLQKTYDAVDAMETEVKKTEDITIQQVIDSANAIITINAVDRNTDALLRDGMMELKGHIENFADSHQYVLTSDDKTDFKKVIQGAKKGIDYVIKQHEKLKCEK